jgi:hypothetical protein
MISTPEIGMKAPYWLPLRTARRVFQGKSMLTSNIILLIEIHGAILRSKD